MRLTLASVACLPAIVIAAPFSSSAASLTASLTITLTKPFFSLFLKSDGFVDMPAVEDYISRVSAKYVDDDSPSLQSRGIIPLNDSNNTEWTGKITIGTPPVTYTALFDTGSSDLVIPTSAGCQDCFEGASYDPTSSSTSKALNKSFSIMYGSGGVSGMEYADTVAIAGLKATGQPLLAANSTAPGFFKNMNALVGLGFTTTGTSGQKTIVQSLREQKQLPSPVFGFKLAATGSELEIGGTNKALYHDPPTYVPVSDNKRWLVHFDKVTLWNRGQVITPNNTAAVVDSGTTLILGDQVTVDNFYGTIYGSEKMDNGMWSVNCYNVPQINITFAGHEIAIPSNIFTLGQIDVQRCLGGIQSGPGLRFWVMGDILMRNVYTIFDAAQRRIGFADLK